MRRLQTIKQASLAAVGLMLSASAVATPVNEDGLHQQDWFLQQSFLELADDWHDADAQDKGLAIVWELKGCPLCSRMHETYFNREDIVTTLTEHFDVLQLNFIGLREVTDFDGRELAENALAEQHQIQGTPTWQFFLPGDAPGNAGDDDLRIVGLPPADEFLARLRVMVRSQTTHPESP